MEAHPIPSNCVARPICTTFTTRRMVRKALPTAEPPVEFCQSAQAINSVVIVQQTIDLNNDREIQCPRPPICSRNLLTRQQKIWARPSTSRNRWNPLLCSSETPKDISDVSPSRHTLKNMPTFIHLTLIFTLKRSAFMVRYKPPTMSPVPENKHEANSRDREILSSTTLSIWRKPRDSLHIYVSKKTIQV